MRVGPRVITLFLPLAAHAGTPARFATLDRMDETARLIVEYGHHAVDDSGPVDLSGSRIGLAGQYPLEKGGIYGHLALTEATASYEGDSSSRSGVTALEVGGFGHWREGPLLLIARGGLSLPNASEDAGGFANGLTTFQRLTDFVNVVPNALTPRGSLSLQTGGSGFLARFDGGLDLLIPTDDAGDGADNELFLRANAGVAATPDPVSIGLEWANIVNLTDEDERDFEDSHLNTLGLRFAWLARYAQPALTVILPLDDDIRDDLLVIMVGVDVLGLP